MTEDLQQKDIIEHDDIQHKFEKEQTIEKFKQNRTALVEEVIKETRENSKEDIEEADEKLEKDL